MNLNNLGDFTKDEENSSTRNKKYTCKDRVEIGCDVNPSVDCLSNLGMYDLPTTYRGGIDVILRKVTANQHDSFVCDVYLWFVCRCYEYNINYDEVKCALREDFGFRDDIVDHIYLNYLENHISNSLSRVVYQNEYNRTTFSIVQLDKFEDKVVNLLKLCGVSANPIKHTSNGDIELNINEGKTYHITDKIDHRSGMFSIEKKELLTLTPTSVIVYKNCCESSTKTLFKWKFITRTGETILRLPETLDVTAQWIKSSGYYQRPWDLHALLSNCLDALLDESIRTGGNQYIVKSDLAVKGFHLENNEIKVEDYKLNTYTLDELRVAIDELHTYKKYFTQEEEAFFATTFKWGLFAPFNVCYKQRNRFIYWLYLHGEGGVGKTMGYGGLIGHLWFDEFKNDFYIATDRYSTPARLGNILSRTTFPVCLNETESVFEPEDNKEIRALYKDATECIILRETQGSGGSVDYAYSPCICTSNGYIQDSSNAITRRSLLMCFSMQIREEKSEYINEFDSKYHMTFKDCRLNKLRAISHTFTHYLMQNTQLLDDDWKKVVDTFLTTLYEKIGYEKPDWLDLWVDNEDSIQIQVHENRERVKISIQKEINSARTINMSNEPEIYVKEVLKKHLLPGMSINRKSQIQITQSFINDLAQKGLIEHKQKLSQFAKNYGWQYDNKAFTVQGKTYKGCWMNYHDFIKWIYGDELVGEILTS